MNHVTVIVLATSNLTEVGAPAPRSPQDWKQIADTAAQAASAGMQTICVVSPDTDISQANLPPACQILNTSKTASWIERGIARAVEATSQSSGWLILAAQSPLPPDTIRRMVMDTVGSGPTAAIPSVGVGGSCETAIGLGSEFYSELIRLDRMGDLKKLMCRYPVQVM